MIEVRIRLASRTDPIRLCEWPSDQLDTLIPTIEQWGLQGDNAGKDLTGEFVMTDTDAFFEVIVWDEEDA